MASLREERKRMILKDRVAIVTGSTSGIGRAAAIEFAREGAKVVVNGRNGADGLAVVRSIRDSGGEALFVSADVSDGAQVTRMVGQAVDRFGTVDILFNNAGMQIYKSLMDTSEEEWDRTFAVNVRGHFLCSKAVIPLMEKAGKGVILNCASIASFISLGGGDTAYVATKGAVMAMTRDMAMSLIRKNIRVLALCPGATMTGIISRCVSAGVIDLEEFKLTQPTRRIATPEEMGRIAALLVSDDFSWVIGEGLLVDGGFTIR
jgi:NAD(P)-dependent dehydrogenase (short-subunit alcohol dehydrogenase family)